MLAPCPLWAMAFVWSGCCLLPVPAAVAAAVPGAVPSSFFLRKVGSRRKNGLGHLSLEPGRKKVGKFHLGHGIRAEQDAAWWDQLHC